MEESVELELRKMTNQSTAAEIESAMHKAYSPDGFKGCPPTPLLYLLMSAPAITLDPFEGLPQYS